METRAFMLFKRHTQTPEELQQEDRRATEDQFGVFLSEVNVLWLRWLWMKWLELSWSLRRSNLRSVVVVCFFSGFSCIFWNSLAKGIFIKNICHLAISHLIKNKRVYTVLLSLRHRLLYYWTWTDSVAKVLRMRTRAVTKCNSKINKNVILCVFV